MDAEFQFVMIKKILEMDDDDDNVNLLNVTEIKMVKMVNCMLCIFSKNKKIHKKSPNKTKNLWEAVGLCPGCKRDQRVRSLNGAPRPHPVDK